ncbi:helix-turn-helix domain-containing protein [Deinococcus peraridilitoris]|nr:helix-turn-helix domain-containing protein [Deinococcus peraridilitoris]
MSTTDTSLQDALVYTPKELQVLLKLSKNTVYGLLISGTLRSIQIGRKRLIPRGAVEDYLRGGERAEDPPPERNRKGKT